MSAPLMVWHHRVGFWVSAVFWLTSAAAQTPAVSPPPASSPSAAASKPPASPWYGYDPDTKALALAHRYLQGGEDAREAVLEALRDMGWGLRNAKGTMLIAPPAGTDTGLALRDYELTELLLKPNDQPAVRLISMARALAVPAESVDPEELAQELVECVRKSAESTWPQERFWARFIVALGRVSPANYDLMKPAPPPVIPPSPASAKKTLDALMPQLAKNPLQPINPMEFMAQSQPILLYPDEDPVLGPSPRPKRGEGDTLPTIPERDDARMSEINEEMGKLADEISSGNPARMTLAQEKMARLTAESMFINGRVQSAMLLQQARMMKVVQAGGQVEGDFENRFLAEWRDQPLCMLQVVLLTRVFIADVIQSLSASAKPEKLGRGRLPFGLPLATIRVAQLATPSFGQQQVGAAGDQWATGTTNLVSRGLDRRFPRSIDRMTQSERLGLLNAGIAWIKTLLALIFQNINVEVDNAPLVRTKTTTANEERTARCTVKIDLPQWDGMKFVRAGMNLAGVDPDLPSGGAQPGAKVVWRLLEGHEGAKYHLNNGGTTYKPGLAVVELKSTGNGVVVSMTDDSGVATATLRGKAQKKDLPSTARPYPRRAAVGVDVTLDVGNLIHDITDAASTALAGPVAGGLTLVAEMMLRTSFFFQKGRIFQVTDWKEPAWEGEFEITVAAGGNKHVKGVKGAPDVDLEWKMDRYMKGRLHTPDWAEEDEQEQGYSNVGSHVLVVDGDPRGFRLRDSSKMKGPNFTQTYEASGPIQIQPPGRNQMEIWSRAEPSGNAVLEMKDRYLTLTFHPAFTAECIVRRTDDASGRSAPKSSVERLSLLNGLVDSFHIFRHLDEDVERIDITETNDTHGYLPWVPPFPATVTVRVSLWKNGPPPRPAEN